MDQSPLERHKRVCRGLVTDFVANIFHDLCPRLSPRGSFGESRHNGIWAYASTTITCAAYHAAAYAIDQ